MDGNGSGLKCDRTTDVLVLPSRFQNRTYMMNQSVKLIEDNGKWTRNVSNWKHNLASRQAFPNQKGAEVIAKLSLFNNPNCSMIDDTSSQSNRSRRMQKDSLLLVSGQQTSLLLCIHYYSRWTNVQVQKQNPPCSIYGVV